MSQSNTLIPSVSVKYAHDGRSAKADALGDHLGLQEALGYVRLTCGHLPIIMNIDGSKMGITLSV